MSARGIQVVRVLIYQNLCLVMVPENAAPRMQLGAGRSEYTTGVVLLLVEAKWRLDTKIAAYRIPLKRINKCLEIRVKNPN